ncbi:MAG: Y-family DNA polymerase [Nitrososphaeria archaeon]
MSSNIKLIALVDMDYFFAQCEELRKPELKGRPVAVCMFTAPERGAISSANYVARKLGAKVGMPVSMAKLQVNDLITLPVDMPYYSSLSSKIMHALIAQYSKVEVASIDEAYVEFEASDHEDAIRIGSEIKDLVLNVSGIVCTVGIGQNKLIAKMVCDSIKPNGLRVVMPEESAAFIEKSRLNSIPYIGSKTVERLETLGCSTVDDARKLPVELLESEFGRKKGIFIYNALRGIDERAIQTNRVRKEYEKFATLGHKDPFNLIDELSASLFLKLSGIKFQEIGIIIIYEDMTVRTKAKTLKFFANSIDSLKAEGKQLFREIQTLDDKKIRRIGLRVSKLRQINYLSLSDYTE